MHGAKDPQKKYDWGWTNGPLASSNCAYFFDLVTHDRDVHAKKVGSVVLDYSGDEAVLAVEAGRHLKLSKTFAYIGTDRLPRIDGDEGVVESIDPFTFPLTHKRALRMKRTRATRLSL